MKKLNALFIALGMITSVQALAQESQVAPQSINVTRVPWRFCSTVS